MTTQFLADKLKIARDIFPLTKMEKEHFGQRGKVLLATDRTRGGTGPLILRCSPKALHNKRKVWVRDVLRRHS